MQCECGCGQETRLAPWTDKNKKWKAGQPVRFKRGHAARVFDWNQLKRPVEDRLWEKVEKTESCWNWKGHVNHGGYGSIFVSKEPNKFCPGQVAFVHRLAWQLANGPIPEGLTIDHLCKNIRCVNPAHMEVVTSAINTLRGSGFTAVNARKKSCKRGHLLEGENVRMDNEGKSRRCRTCERIRKGREVGFCGYGG